MMLLPTFMVAISASVGVPTCSDNTTEKEIELSEAFVVERAELTIPSSPVLREPRVACVRVEFCVSDEGLATNISVAETSGERKLDIAAINALKKYKFIKPQNSVHERLTLVFRDVIR